MRVSPIREGWIARTHFIDACASAWIDGELVHIEDLVLHNASMDIRSPTRELTRPDAVLRARRRILFEAQQWALTPSGLNALIGRAAVSEPEGQGVQRAREEEAEAFDEEGLALYESGDDGPLAGHLAGLEAISQRTNRLLSELATRPPESRDPMVYDLDWDENARMASWREAVGSTENMPSLLAAAIALLAWEEIDPLQHRAWLGRLLVAAILRDRSRTLSHLLCVNTGLREIARDRRRERDLTTKLVALLDGFVEAAKRGMRARPMAARPPSARPEISRSAFELEPARACGSRSRAADRVRRPNCPGAQSELACRARSRGRAGPPRDDGQGEVSRLGDIVRLQP